MKIENKPFGPFTVSYRDIKLGESFSLVGPRNIVGNDIWIKTDRGDLDPEDGQMVNSEADDQQVVPRTMKLVVEV